MSVSPTSAFVLTGGESQVYDMATDSAGNVFITGKFTGTVDFDPGATHAGSTDVLTATSGVDAYVAKYIPGTPLSLAWVRPINGAAADSSDSGHAVAVDDYGNAYVEGRVQNVAGASVHFTQKLSADGTVAWMTIGLSTTYPAGYIAVNSAGVYIAGAQNVASTSNVFVSKLDAATGDVIWTSAPSLGANGNGVANGMDLDNAGNLYVTGTFFGQIGFGSTTLVATSAKPTSASDIFLTKVNPRGGFDWATKMGGAGYDDAAGIVYADGSLYLTGAFGRSTRSFAKGESAVFGGYTLKSAGMYDVYVVKTTLGGTTSPATVQWAKGFGGTSNDWGIEVAADQVGNIYLTGIFWGTVDFNPDPSASFLKTSSGNSDPYVSQFTASGGFVNAWQIITSADSSWGFGIAADPFGNVYAAGHVRGQVSFPSGESFDTGSDTTSKGFVLQFTRDAVASAVASAHDELPDLRQRHRRYKAVVTRGANS
jgi:hypothetical protein